MQSAVESITRRRSLGNFVERFLKELKNTTKVNSADEPASETQTSANEALDLVAPTVDAPGEAILKMRRALGKDDSLYLQSGLSIVWSGESRTEQYTLFPGSLEAARFEESSIDGVFAALRNAIQEVMRQRREAYKVADVVLLALLSMPSVLEYLKKRADVLPQSTKASFQAAVDAVQFTENTNIDKINDILDTIDPKITEAIYKMVGSLVSQRLALRDDGRESALEAIDQICAERCGEPTAHLNGDVYPNIRVRDNPNPNLVDAIGTKQWASYYYKDSLEIPTEATPTDDAARAGEIRNTTRVRQADIQNVRAAIALGTVCFPGPQHDGYYDGYYDEVQGDTPKWDYKHDMAKSAIELILRKRTAIEQLLRNIAVHQEDHSNFGAVAANTHYAILKQRFKDNVKPEDGAKLWWTPALLGGEITAFKWSDIERMGHKSITQMSCHVCDASICEYFAMQAFDFNDPSEATMAIKAAAKIRQLGPLSFVVSQIADNKTVAVEMLGQDESQFARQELHLSAFAGIIVPFDYPAEARDGWDKTSVRQKLLKPKECQTNGLSKDLSWLSAGAIGAILEKGYAARSAYTSVQRDETALNEMHRAMNVAGGGVREPFPGSGLPVDADERGRRTAVWEDALRELSISGDRLYAFMRTMAGLQKFVASRAQRPSGGTLHTLHTLPAVVCMHPIPVAPRRVRAVATAVVAAPCATACATAHFLLNEQDAARRHNLHHQTGRSLHGAKCALAARAAQGDQSRGGRICAENDGCCSFQRV